MAVDFTTPVKTQNYDTGVLQSIRANQIAIASFLDGQTITGNTSGLKRYNASTQMFEKSDGTNWSTMPLAYLPLGGGTLNGALVLSGNASASLNPVPLQQLNSALSGYAMSSALANYALLSGASFSGAVTTGGNVIANGSVSAAYIATTGTGAIVAAGPVYGGNGSLTTTGLFYIGASNATTPVLNFDSNDCLAYDRSGNTLSTVVNNNAVTVTQTGAFLVNGLCQAQAATNVEVDLGLSNPNTLLRHYLRGDGTAGMYDATRGIVRYNADTAGNFTTVGLLYGRGGGAGLGQITVQSGGSPSGGAAGDLFLIY